MTPEAPIVDELAAIAAFYAERDALAAQQPAPEPLPEPLVAEPQPPAPQPTMNEYFIRCKEADRPKLYALAEALGILTNTEGVYTLAGGWEGGWDEVGLDLPGRESRVFDHDGNPYWHANLRLRIVSLTEHAMAVAAGNPDVAAALGDLAGWFVADANGAPVPPKQPAQVWL